MRHRHPVVHDQDGERRAIVMLPAISKASSAGDNEFATAGVPLGTNWAGTIESVRVSWAAPKGTTVEVDWIRVQ